VAAVNNAPLGRSLVSCGGDAAGGG
jgi:hypothetical protein